MKNVALILGLIIAASPAFASRARLESLGEGKNGSYYINDSRNIFLNPAQIVKHKKKLWLEFGGNPANTSTDVQETPRGQGGFSNTFGDFTYGLYLNNTSDVSISSIAGLGNSAFGAGTFIAPDSQVEAFFAGEGGMNWGVSLFYAGNNVRALNGSSEQTASSLGARLGIESGALSVFASLGLGSKSSVLNGAANNNEVKGTIAIDAGVTYAMDAFTWFGKFNTLGADINTVTVTEFRTSGFGAGFGYTKEFSKTVTMFSRLEADYQKQTLTGGTADVKSWNVPIVLGAEAQALSWLAVRGSIASSLVGQRDGNGTNPNARDNLAGTTTVAAGLGATFGDVNIDGVLQSGTTGTSYPGFGTGTSTTGKFGFGDNMLTRVALTYNF